MKVDGARGPHWRSLAVGLARALTLSHPVAIKLGTREVAEN